jgi:hypothetical protein
MRIFTCRIRNAGDGDIVWVDDSLAHGEWSEGKGPSQDTNTIKPNETREFEARSGGDIPIIGSLATGTEGWALFKTRFAEFIGSPQEAFIKISWDIPFITFDSEDGARVEATRFDPRQNIGPGQFDDRNKTPPGLQLSAFFAGPDGGDHVIDGLPWVFICPPMVLSGAKLGINLSLVVDGTVAPGQTKIPSFSDKKNAKPIPEPRSNTNPSMWTGLWSGGDGVSARISLQSDNRLSVTISENGRSPRTYENPNVSISRVVYSFAQTQFVSASAVARSETSLGDKIKLYVQEGIGTSRAVSKPIGRRTALYKELVTSHLDIVGSLASQQHQIGGDYLSLQEDATLEIYRMVSHGQVVDVALRYRRPSSIPSLYSVAHFDEMLYFRPDVH